MPVDPLAAVRALAASIRTRSLEIERARRLPDDLVAALIDAGVFRLCIPRALGGFEVPVATLAEVIETVAAADGSAGWCSMIGATTGVVSGSMPIEAAREIWSDPRTVTGGVFAPRGTATPVDDGYRVSGRWAFASGVQHSTWLLAGCTIAGAPDVPPRMMLLPRDAVEIIDTWSVGGLCGTGSHDFAVTDVRVPAGRSVALGVDAPTAPGALYRFPAFGLLALGIAAVTLGLARAAIDALVELAVAKVPTGSRRRLAERPAIQADVAQAEAELGSARAWLYEHIARATDVATRDGTIPLDVRIRLRLAATHASAAATRAVDRMYAAGGGTAIYATSPLQRCFRDVHTATAHVMVGPATWEVTGRALLGLPVDAREL